MLETVVFCLSIVVMFTVVSVIKANHKLKILMDKEKKDKEQEAIAANLLKTLPKPRA